MPSPSSTAEFEMDAMALSSQGGEGKPGSHQQERRAFMPAVIGASAQVAVAESSAEQRRFVALFAGLLVLQNVDGSAEMEAMYGIRVRAKCGDFTIAKMFFLFEMTKLEASGIDGLTETTPILTFLSWEGSDLYKTCSPEKHD
jgi:hypothetical protein